MTGANARPLVCVLLAGCALIPVAAEADLSVEDVFFADLPVVLSATRLRQSPVEAPVALSIIDRATIAASGITDIPEIFRLVPGFQVAQITGNTYAVTYHGLADAWPRRMEVMVNGRSVYLPILSATVWNALGIAIDDIERIEVVRGSNTPTYGSNALLASINIVTRDPYVQKGTYVEVTGGSLDTGNLVLRHGGNIGSMDAVVTAQYHDTSGYENMDDHSRLVDLAFRGTMQTPSQDNLSIELGLTTGTAGAEGLLYFNGARIRPTEERDLTSSYQHIKWTRAADNGHEYQLSFAHTRMDHDETFPLDLEPLIGLPISVPFAYYEGIADRYDITFQDTIQTRDDVRVVWGAMARYDEIASDLMLGDNDSVSEWSQHLFGNVEWRATDKLLFNFGGLAEHHEDDGPYASLRASAGYLFSPNNSFRLAASRGYRMESLLEKSMDYPIDLGFTTFQFVQSIGELEPEELTTYEMGYHGDWIHLGLSADIRVFREELRKEATAVENARRETYWIADGGYWNTDGLELELHYSPTETTRFLLSYGYANVEGRSAEDIDNGEKITGWHDLSDGTPQNTLGLQISHRFGEFWRASANYYHMDGFRWQSEVGSHINDYDRVDLKLARNLKLGKADAEVSLVVQNLFDKDLPEFNDDTIFERRGYLQFKMALP